MHQWCAAGVLIRAAAVTVPVRAHMVTFWRHFAVLTVLSREGHIEDHLFLVREGWLYLKIWKFKVMTLRPVFESGTMTGLMTTFR